MSVNNIIRVDDDTTFPSSVQKIIKEKLPVLTRTLKNLQKNEIRYELQDKLTITDKAIVTIAEQIDGILEDYFFEGYHNTRTLIRNELRETGLLLLSTKSYIQYMRNVFSDLGITVPKQEAAFQIINEYLDNKYGNRINQISIYAPHCLCQDHRKFTKNIGGEICEFGLKDSLPDVYEQLALHGYPITIKFSFPFQSIVDWQKSYIIIEIIRHFAAKFVFNYDYRIAITTTLVEPIKPENIIEIIDFVDEN